MWLLRVDPQRDGVTIGDDGSLAVSFGRFRVTTGVGNVDGARRTGPYRWWTAVGVRLSLVDDGLTFGTTAAGGVCITFVTPIPKVIGFRPTHSALTVTVADPEGLLDALGRR